MNFGELLLSVFIDLQSIYRNRIKIHSTSFPQILALVIIPGDGIEMSAVSKKLGVDNSTATRMITGLENKGWVRRDVDIHDKRIIKVFLTGEGNTIQSQLEMKFDEIGDAIGKRLEHTDQNEMKENIRSLNWILAKFNLK
tara:strand:- start:1855 stop:2274 length:420 start_codon:yes stop_codon:yes gene_type:complete